MYCGDDWVLLPTPDLDNSTVWKYFCLYFVDNNVFKNSDTECANCKLIIENIKSKISCTLCKKSFHAKCEGIE